MKNILHSPQFTVHSVFFLFFGLFLYTAYPTVSPYRDSGDLAAASITLGIAHPPGYPLYALAGHAWLNLLPFGDPAYRLNVLSALAGAAALAFLYIVLQGEGSLVAAASVLILGLAPAFWKLSLVSEMYALNALFASAVFLLLSRPPLTAHRWLFISFLLGLGIANHQTLILIVPGLLLLAFPSHWEGWRKAPGWATPLFLLLGLSIFLYLPLRSLQDPLLNWGEPKNFHNLWRIITRADYGGLRLHPERSLTLSWETIRDAALVSWKAFSAQVGPLVLAVCFVGAWLKRRDAFGRFCLLGFLLSGPFFILLSNLPPDSVDTLPILEPHLVLPLICLVPLFVYGAAAAKNYAPLLLLILLPLTILRPASSHRFDFSAHDYEQNVLTSLPKDSILIDPDDPTAFTLSYFATARAAREDVVPLLYFRTRWGYEQLHRRHPDVVPSSIIQSGHELYFYVLDFNLGKGRGVYADLPHKALDPYRTFPLGWAYRVYRPGAAPPDAAGWYQRSLDLWELSRARPAAADDFFTVHALDYGASALNNLGVSALNDRKYDLAETVFKRSVVAQPKLDQGWNNWGNVLYQRKEYARASAAYRIALAAKELPTYRYNLGRSLMAAGRLDDAEKEMTAATERADIPDAFNDLGLLALQRGEAQKAADAFEALLRRHGTYRPAVYNLGLAKAKLGLKTEAVKAFEYYRDTAQDPADKADAESWLRKLK